MDTAVSRSTDNGATWSYTVANYLGDNGNRFNRDSTAFIDPALLADGDTIYLACDLLPAGLAVANAARYPAKAGCTGYDTKGNLLLALSTTSVNGLSSSTALFEKSIRPIFLLIIAAYGVGLSSGCFV